MIVKIYWTSKPDEHDVLEVPYDIKFRELIDMIDEIVKKHDSVVNVFKHGYIINKLNNGYEVEIYNDYRE